MGTLDPLASGVLPVAVGNATRLLTTCFKSKRVYRAQFAFGTETDTLDRAGRVTKCGGRKSPPQTRSPRRSPLLSASTTSSRPRTSAKNVNGVRAYDPSRGRGRRSRSRPSACAWTLWNFSGKRAKASLRCASSAAGGTYIRSPRARRRGGVRHVRLQWRRSCGRRSGPFRARGEHSPRRAHKGELARLSAPARRGARSAAA